MRLPSALAAAVTVVALCTSRCVLPLPAQNTHPYVEHADILRGTVIKERGDGHGGAKGRKAGIAKK